jgi:hypothetical protein
MNIYCTTQGLNTRELATPCGDGIARERCDVCSKLLQMTWELATPCGDEIARERRGVCIHLCRCRWLRRLTTRNEYRLPWEQLGLP